MSPALIQLAGWPVGEAATTDSGVWSEKLQPARHCALSEHGERLCRGIGRPDRGESVAREFDDVAAAALDDLDGGCEEFGEAAIQDLVTLDAVLAKQRLGQRREAGNVHEEYDAIKVVPECLVTQIIASAPKTYISVGAINLKRYAASPRRHFHRQKRHHRLAEGHCLLVGEPTHLAVCLAADDAMEFEVMQLRARDRRRRAACNRRHGGHLRLRDAAGGPDRALERLL